MESKKNPQTSTMQEGSRCDLCGCSSPAVRCDKCNMHIFCLSCDDMYHRHPKRKTHLRRAVDTLISSGLTPRTPPPLPPADPFKIPIPPPRRKKKKTPYRGFGVSSIPEAGTEKDFLWSDNRSNKFVSGHPLPQDYDVIGTEHIIGQPIFRAQTTPDLRVINKPAEKQNSGLHAKDNIITQSTEQWPVDNQEWVDEKTIWNENSSVSSGSPFASRVIPRGRPYPHFATGGPNRIQSFSAADISSAHPYHSDILPHPLISKNESYLHPDFPSWYGGSCGELPSRQFDSDEMSEEISSHAFQKPVRRTQSMMHDSMAPPGSYFSVGRFIQEDNMEPFHEQRQNMSVPASPSISTRYNHHGSRHKRRSLSGSSETSVRLSSKRQGKEHRFKSKRIECESSSEEDFIRNQETDGSKSASNASSSQDLSQKVNSWIPNRQWKCEHCTFRNPAGSWICEICCRTNSKARLKRAQLEKRTSKCSSQSSLQQESDAKNKRNHNMETKGILENPLKQEEINGYKRNSALSNNDLNKEVESLSSNLNSKDFVRSLEVKPKDLTEGSSDNNYLLHVVNEETPALFCVKQDEKKDSSVQNSDISIIPASVVSTSSHQETTTNQIAQTCNPLLDNHTQTDYIIKPKNIVNARGSSLDRDIISKKKVPFSCFQDYLEGNIGTDSLYRSISRPSLSTEHTDFSLANFQFQPGSAAAGRLSFWDLTVITQDVKDAKDVMKDKMNTKVIQSGKTNVKEFTGDRKEEDFIRNFANRDYSIHNQDTTQSPSSKLHQSMEELAFRLRQESEQNEGVEIIQMIKEIERLGFVAEDLPIALKKCGKQNPISWLQENWKKMTEAVVNVAQEYAYNEKEDFIGIISETEAQESLRTYEGDILAAVSECVKSRKRKFLELMSRGNFPTKEIALALTTNEGNIEKAYSALAKSAMTPFLQHISNLEERTKGNSEHNLLCPSPVSNRSRTYSGETENTVSTQQTVAHNHNNNYMTEEKDTKTNLRNSGFLSKLALIQKESKIQQKSTMMNLEANDKEEEAENLYTNVINVNQTRGLIESQENIVVENKFTTDRLKLSELETQYHYIGKEEKVKDGNQLHDVRPQDFYIDVKEYFTDGCPISDAQTQYPYCSKEKSDNDEIQMEGSCIYEEEYITQGLPLSQHGRQNLYTSDEQNSTEYYFTDRETKNTNVHQLSDRENQNFYVEDKNVNIGNHHISLSDSSGFQCDEDSMKYDNLTKSHLINSGQKLNKSRDETKTIKYLDTDKDPLKRFEISSLQTFGKENKKEERHLEIDMKVESHPEIRSIHKLETHRREERHPETICIDKLEVDKKEERHPQTICIDKFETDKKEEMDPETSSIHKVETDKEERHSGTSSVHKLERDRKEERHPETICIAKLEAGMREERHPETSSVHKVERDRKEERHPETSPIHKLETHREEDKHPVQKLETYMKEERHPENISTQSSEADRQDDRHTKTSCAHKLETDNKEERHPETICTDKFEIEYKEEIIPETSSIHKVETDKKEERYSETISIQKLERDRKEERHPETICIGNFEADKKENEHTETICIDKIETDKKEKRHPETICTEKFEIEHKEEIIPETSSIHKVETDKNEERYSETISLQKLEIDRKEERHPETICIGNFEADKKENEHTETICIDKIETDKKEERHPETICTEKFEIEHKEEIIPETSSIHKVETDKRKRGTLKPFLYRSLKEIGRKRDILKLFV
ncbi:uncharacterized protein LOC143240203 [Tachypleus tridentatus]|uniref:uncharacterized protein LOC143240203 n=1 Tax=Tachypleus tridentatus TaxID=6853 RepID=UPI003FCF8C3F